MPASTMTNLPPLPVVASAPPTSLFLVTILACFLIGLSSMVSLFLFNLFIHRRNPFTTTTPLSSTTLNGHPTPAPVPFIADPSKSEILKSVLSFAVGGLLGDVFLHLLPEACVQLTGNGYSTMEAQQFLGAWILVGILFFLLFETVFVQLHKDKEEDEEEENAVTQNGTSNGTANGASNGVGANGLKHRKTPNGTQNGHPPQLEVSASAAPSPVSATGYLNLLANGFDNFTHGMSVGASFLVSFKMGCLTTLAIAIHEIPHEIVDYVILLRSGFSCWNAFRAQLSISLVTILGSLMVLYCDSASETLSFTLWILPFTAGGFIFIALSSLLPELLNFESPSQSSKVSKKSSNNGSSALHNVFCLLQRTLFVMAGVATMAAVNFIDIF